ncbi:hypothetical protein G6F57_018322 [Rhizopus arrhizus]|nr:hypothetical protein G6F57_018322 [Rhizopus arrhizus]
MLPCGPNTCPISSPLASTPALVENGYLSAKLGLRRLHGHGVALDQRADQQRTQGLALRRRQAGQHLLVDQLERVGQLRVLAFQRLAHQQQRARTRVALVVDQVETRADLRQGVHVVAQQRLVVARDHQAGHVGELAAHRPHRDLLPAGRDFGGLGLALAQDHPLEPGDHARLCLRNAGVDQRGVVPGRLFISRVDQFYQR